MAGNAPTGMKLYEVEINGTKTVLQMTQEDKDKRFPKTAKEVKGRSAQDIAGGIELGATGGTTDGSGSADPGK